MPLKGLETLPPEAVNRLNPVRVREYARATGWVLEPRLGQGLTAVYERPESRLEQISIPLRRDLADFTLVMATAVAWLAQWENRPVRDLLDELLLPPADLLRFQDAGPASGGIAVRLDRGLALAV